MADYVVDLGPGAGEHGGEVIFQGPPAELLADGNGSLTGAYLRGERTIPTPKARRPSLKGEPTLRIAFGKEDKDIVYVRRTVGILSNILALPVSALTVAKRPLTDYLELTLPSFERT